MEVMMKAQSTAKKGTKAVSKPRKSASPKQPTIWKQVPQEFWRMGWSVAIGAGIAIAGSFFVQKPLDLFYMYVGGGILMQGFLFRSTSFHEKREWDTWTGSDRLWHIISWMLTLGTILGGIRFMTLDAGPFVSFAGVLLVVSGIGVFHPWTYDALPQPTNVPRKSVLGFLGIFRGAALLSLVAGTWLWLFTQDPFNIAGLGIFMSGIFLLGTALVFAFYSGKRADIERYNRWTMTGRMNYIMGASLSAVLVSVGIGHFIQSTDGNVQSVSFGMLAIGIWVFGATVLFVRAPKPIKADKTAPKPKAR